MEQKFTHAELVEAAAVWLRKKFPLVVTELVAGIGEIPDAIGWKSGYSTLVECKASRADFKADASKFFRREAEFGIGTKRYYLTPPSLLTLDELPAGWGLVEYDGKRHSVKKESEVFRGQNYRHETEILVSLIRRIGSADTKGVSVKLYVIETRNNATVGIEPLESSVTHASLPTPPSPAVPSHPPSTSA